MTAPKRKRLLRTALWLIALIGVIVPRRLRADWRQEWEAELQFRETLLAQWDKLDWRGKLTLLWHSAGAFMDALWLQPRRMEDEMFQDLRYGARMLLRSPGFAVAAVLSLALGIGANTAIFSVVNAVLLKPLPYDHADQIMRLWTTQPERGALRLPFSAPNFVDLKEQNRVFTDMAVFRGWPFILTGAGEPLSVFGHRVSASFFTVLGVKPLLGHGFLYEEDSPGNDRVVIISYGLWQSHFAADPGIIGRSLTVNDISRTVVGVMPPGFRFQSQENAIWIPMAFTPADLNRRVGNTFVLARLRPGVARQQAQAEMNTLAARLETHYPDSNRGKGISVTPLREDMVGDSSKALWVLLGAVGFVLLIACANVANLQLTRALGRRKELAVRVALGATRLRLIRQLLTESAILSLLGGGLGLLFARIGLRLLTSLMTGQAPRIEGDGINHIEEAGISGIVLGFTLLLSILTGFLFGLLPAFQASKPVNEALKEGGAASVSLRRQRVRGAFVIAEVALSIALLAGAGLMIKSFLRLQQVDPGFNPERLLTLETFLPPTRYPKAQQQAAFYQQVGRRLAAVPGIQSVGASIGPPFTGASIGVGFNIEGRAATSPGEQLVASYRAISPNYFQTMGVPLLKGRDFSDGDNSEAPGVTIINQSFARRFFPNEDPVGKRLDIGDGYNRTREIVGVVGDTKANSLKEPGPAEMYVVYLQRPWQWIRYAVRTSAEPESLAPAIRAAVWSVDKDIPINNLKTMERLIAETTTEPRFYLIMLSVFAAIALILSAVGVYGVMSHTVAQRRHEIGVRMALGAGTTDVLKLIVGQGMALALIGVALGLAGAFALTRTLTTLLFTVGPTDPAVFALIALMIVGVALLASLIPARRAVRVNPVVALRQE
jgi:putative ABC transport system permease protein